MATQAVIGVRQNGAVKFKIVAGIDGMKSLAVAEWIKQHPHATAQQIYDKALSLGLGSRECLVVQSSPTEAIFEGDEDLSPLYAKKFHDAKFNPRWEQGIASYVLVVDLEGQ